MAKSRINWWHCLNWMILFSLIGIVFAVILSILAFSISGGFEVVMILLGVIFVFFNGRLYKYMVKYNVWASEKVGFSSIGKGVKSDLYRKFYRIVIFLVWMLLLYFGLSKQHYYLLALCPCELI